MDGGFTKLYGDRLLRSSIWLESIEVRVLWFFFLAAADADGVVDIPNVKVLAHLANMPLDACERALEVLESPDIGSRSPELEGRRVIRDGNVWKIVTHNKYRELRTFRQVKDAQRQAEKRARTKTDASEASTDNVDAYQKSTPEAEAEAEEREGESERELPLPSATPTSPSKPKKPKAKSHALAALEAALKSESAKRGEVPPSLSNSLGQKASRRVADFSKLHKVPLDQAAQRLAATWVAQGSGNAWKLCDVPFGSGRTGEPEVDREEIARRTALLGNV